MPIQGFSTETDRSDPLYIYGSDAAAVMALMNGSKNEWLSASLQIHSAQVKWAVTNEMARTIEDVLSRRTRALLLDAAESVRIAPEVATIMAAILEKDENWKKQQVETFTRLAKNYVLTHN
jgi:glycerol-3-phosphate dehydrogenase